MSTRRIIVSGGFGFFGGAAVERLRADGVTPLIGSRRATADVRLDVENLSTLRAALRPSDVVIDTVGPFQQRTTTLVEAALEIGFDVIDIADNFDFVHQVYELQSRIDASNIRVLTACSSISAVSAAVVHLSRIDEPARLTGLLSPATRYAAVSATGSSLLRSVGQPIRVLRDGKLITETGWRRSHVISLPPPIGTVRGFSFESADGVTLRKIWPSLRTADFYVNTQVPGLNAAFCLAARSSPLRRVIELLQPLGLRLSRMFGSESGFLAYEIESDSGRVVRLAVVAPRRGYFTPVVPAVMAARAIAEDRFPWRGLVPADKHVDPEELVNYLAGIGVNCIEF